MQETKTNSFFAQISNSSFRIPSLLDMNQSQSSQSGENKPINSSFGLNCTNKCNLMSSLKEKACPITTIMLKNIPNSITLSGLLLTIRKRFEGVYDFVYLPMDFKVVFVDQEQVQSRICFHQLHQLQSSRVLRE